jgi:SNF2 family DNA or RNA helicase
MASHPSAALNTIEHSLLPKLDLYAKITHDFKYVIHTKEFITKYKKTVHHLSKSKKLIQILSAHHKVGDKVIVYVNFISTKNALLKLIGKYLPKIPLFEFHGELTAKEKEKVIESFIASSGGVLLSTDAGGQGLNLETASVVVNFDYPWNPMKIEQRIGRIDRINQQSKFIYIYNLITNGTIEQYVYQALVKKLAIFMDTIGDILSPIEIGEEWERKFSYSIGMLILSSEDAKQLKKRFESLDKKSLDLYSQKYSTVMHAKDEWLNKSQLG